MTRKVKVDAVKHLDGIPTHWPIPKVETAYVLDFNKDTRLSKDTETLKGKPKGLDLFLKAEVSDYHIKLTSSDSLRCCHHRIKIHGEKGQMAVHLRKYC